MPSFQVTDTANREFHQTIEDFDGHDAYRDLSYLPLLFFILRDFAQVIRNCIHLIRSHFPHICEILPRTLSFFSDVRIGLVHY